MIRSPDHSLIQFLKKFTPISLSLQRYEALLPSLCVVNEYRIQPLQCPHEPDCFTIRQTD